MLFEKYFLIILFFMKKELKPKPILPNSVRNMQSERLKAAAREIKGLAISSSPLWQYHKYFFFRNRQTTATEVKLKPFKIARKHCAKVNIYKYIYICIKYGYCYPLLVLLMMKMMCDIHLLRLSAVIFIYFLGPSFRIV